MNEELQNAVSALIQKTLNGVEAGSAFLEGQLPDYITQLLMWHGMYNFLLFLLGVGLLVLAAVWPYLIMSKEVRDEWNEGYNNPPWQLLYGLSAIPLGIAVATINLTWLKVWVAPKVWLVEYAASLVK